MCSTKIKQMKKHVLLLFLFLFTLVCQAQTVYKTRTGSKYHTETCRYLKSSFETTVAQAQAEGLSACSVCRPGAGSTSGAGTATSLTPESEENIRSSTSSGSSTGSVQCGGTTKAGARCKRMTTNASGRCYQH